MKSGVTPEAKALIDFLDSYAFIGWCVIKHPEKFNDLIDGLVNEKEPDFHKQLVDEFNNEKLDKMTKAREQE